MTVLEGMASGLPVVATRVDGVLEMATDREHALLVDSGDVPALVQAITEAAEPTTAMKQMCLRAQAHVEEAYNSTTLSSQLHAHYREDVAVPKNISG
jgi:glycosyltransferase involved in cell wall biosynthesis